MNENNLRTHLRTHLDRWIESENIIYLFLSLQNGQHSLLTDSPSISTSTTVTNLESMDNILQTFGSVGSAKKLGTRDQNLRVAQPEIEPLHINKKPEEFCLELNVPYNGPGKKRNYTASQVNFIYFIFYWRTFWFCSQIIYPYNCLLMRVRLRHYCNPFPRIFLIDSIQFAFFYSIRRKSAQNYFKTYTIELVC